MAKRTFKQARTELLTWLGKNGWQISSPSLKVPHATMQLGRYNLVRIWFKPQAIHVGGKTLAEARSLHTADMRTLTGPELVREVEQFTGERLSF